MDGSDDGDFEVSDGSVDGSDEGSALQRVSLGQGIQRSPMTNKQ